MATGEYSLGWFRNDWNWSNSIGSGDRTSSDKNDYDDAYAADLTYVFDNGNSLNTLLSSTWIRARKRWLMDFPAPLVYQTTDLQDEEIWLGLAPARASGTTSPPWVTVMYLTGEVDVEGESLDRNAYQVPWTA